MEEDGNGGSHACLEQARTEMNCGRGSTTVSGSTATKRMIECRTVEVGRTRCGVATSRPVGTDHQTHTSEVRPIESVIRGWDQLDIYAR